VSQPDRSAPQAPPGRVLVVAALILGFAAWLMLRSYTSAGARECQALYRSARTAADTAWIDTTLTAGSRAEQDPKTCGFRRTSNRWQ